ncbi:MAG: quinone-dependent dihydroorotate dehydrogenase [Xanthomonadales bacterium]|nr:quinone-dependent dihydroorotate dehydrogenase [Xanthomonadales bacterium]NIX13870.1 quinone-dependent dihydroorotate dehydrogenase [Xanthomonadales bacterium]
MYSLIRKALFTTSPEAAHELALESLRLGHAFGATQFLHKRPDQPVEVMGLRFPNPVGLAAGMDKNGDYIDALGGLGFGFIEVGTVTPRPQPGNPKPRVFRLEAAEAMINRLGFNNKGVDHLVRQAKRRRYRGILGINIGRNLDTPNERAVEDYLACFEKVYEHADYITVNISSPNTEGLRDLQAETALDELLGTLADRRRQLSGEFDRCVPIAVKVAPDLDEAGIESIASVTAAHRIDAVIATNTTIERPGVGGMAHAEEAGGLSGAPLRQRADEVLECLRAALPPEIALVGVGGITRGEHAARKLELGADLVQFYTGFVYRGPDLIPESLDAIAAQRAAA